MLGAMLVVGACGEAGDPAGEEPGGGGAGGGGGFEERACEPGERRACYTGPEGTEGIGICRAGEEVCAADGAGFGACEGEQTPTMDACGPEDCDEACIVPACGNGVREPGEACDEGEENGFGRACTADCEAQRIREVALGSGHACARLLDGAVKCWGGGMEGQLGNEANAYLGDEAEEMGARLAPVSLGADRAAEIVGAGGHHSCARLDDGSLRCWGANHAGQLGLGHDQSRGNAPGQMGEALPAVALGAGRVEELAGGWNHGCALLDDGSLRCWGRNDHGQLGLGDTENRGDEDGEMGESLPAVDFGAAGAVRAVAAGEFHGCAVVGEGQVRCWGANDRGQLGLGDTEERHAPGPAVDLGEGARAVELTAGDAHTCARLEDGRVKCWGKNDRGQLGLGEGGDRGDEAGEMGEALAAVDFGTGRRALAVEAGANHTCAILDDQRLVCWGENRQGQLGLGDVMDRGAQPDDLGDFFLAVDLGAGRSAEAVRAGRAFTCALLDDDTLKCWGGNEFGQLGLGDKSYRGNELGQMGDALPAVRLF